MAVSGGNGGDVTLRLRLDTASAKAELDRFLGGMHGTARIAGEVSGGFLGSILGAGLPGLGRLALGAEFAAPMLGDLHRVLQGTLGGLGTAASMATGLRSVAREAGIPLRSLDEAEGLAGLGALGGNDEQRKASNRALYSMVKGLNEARAAAASQFEKDVGQDFEQSVVQKLDVVLSWFISDGIPLLAATLVAGRASAAVGGGIAGNLAGGVAGVAAYSGAKALMSAAGAR